jgi:uncharacterized membrane protein
MNIHPLVVHFPIALLLAAALLEGIGILTRREEFSRAAWWNQLFGTIGLATAVLTGIRARDLASLSGDSLELFELHEQSAFLVAALFAGLLLWRLGTRTRVPANHRWLYFLLFAAGIVLLAGAAWFGGELVFRFGAGVTRAPA